MRQDAFAKAHPLIVEEEKDARVRGFYIHPELYGQPREKQIEWAPPSGTDEALAAETSVAAAAFRREARDSGARAVGAEIGSTKTLKEFHNGYGTIFPEVGAKDSAM